MHKDEFKGYALNLALAEPEGSRLEALVTPMLVQRVSIKAKEQFF